MQKKEKKKCPKINNNTANAPYHDMSVNGHITVQILNLIMFLIAGVYIMWHFERTLIFFSSFELAVLQDTFCTKGVSCWSAAQESSFQFIWHLDRNRKSFKGKTLALGIEFT